MFWLTSTVTIRNNMEQVWVVVQIYVMNFDLRFWGGMELYTMWMFKMKTKELRRKGSKIEKQIEGGNKQQQEEYIYKQL